ncbi:MAG: isoprenyl transferase [Parvibaculum sp.]|uniref:isoprenyl transferase n=1 Tax=Parvibaculum sp. TaxID=2024848 RepID=UPI00283C282A|nr:isoprenyl transferase [Parvibaculum sp.]MDR3500104.1 isoprenyl transferase [Parvibaculum sp.]
MSTSDQSASLSEVDLALEMPRHVAIIMDGNRRWAAKRLLPRQIGHRQGVEAVRVITRAAGEMGIRYLTLYGFSSENWKRPADEVSDLMGLLRLFIRRDLAELHQNGVQVRIIGEREHLEADIVALIDEAETLTRDNANLKLMIAFNYGGQNEITSAVRRIAREVKAGRFDPDAITPETVAAHLDTAGVPDPDLIIRTSGEKRLSNFLIWQSAYAELVFTDVLWPDFTPDRLKEAVAEFKLRDRRFGAVAAAKP